jgi:hypothetical protein
MLLCALVFGLSALVGLGLRGPRSLTSRPCKLLDRRPRSGAACMFATDDYK